ncbi:GNAT family N-acetyltransferase [Thalassospira marina]|uniref:GNAT family N-acetyltransferase n=1 Tax=Thalassospira marina TaxID=2048283 RepID=A0ABN5F9E0_9PROT|nr:GNAT family N-acetyltransferase [Thalassospira marina]AUG51347.1 GNAT family N-acetyltransferase [Thalassospira marina]
MDDKGLADETARHGQNADGPAIVAIGNGEWKTARLTLRVPQQDDLSFLQDMFSRPELTRHRPNPTPDDASTTRDRMARDRAHWAEHGFGRWAVLVDGRRIGFGGVTQSLQFEGLNLSYHLHPDYWGKGYGLEIARAAIAFAINDLAAQRIIGLARPANPASQRVLLRAGLVYQRDVPLHGAMTGLFELRC